MFRQTTAIASGEVNVEKPKGMITTLVDQNAHIMSDWLGRLALSSNILAALHRGISARSVIGEIHFSAKNEITRNLFPQTQIRTDKCPEPNSTGKKKVRQWMREMGELWFARILPNPKLQLAGKCPSRWNILWSGQILIGRYKWWILLGMVSYEMLLGRRKSPLPGF